MPPVPANWALPVLIFLSVALFVWGASLVLTGGGDAHRSRLKQRLTGRKPQPAAAQDQAKALLQQQAQGTLHELFGRYHFFQELRLSLKQSMPDLSVEKFMSIAGVVTVLAFILGFALTTSFIAAIAAATIGLYVPFLVVARKKMKRQRMLAQQLPDGLDFLGRSLRAGHSLPVGLQLMGTELPAPLCEEFGRCYDEISLGVDSQDALKAMTERIDSTDFAFFVTAVLVQRQTGGDLAQVLDNITGMLRQRIQLAQHVKAKTAEGRFTGYILAAFPLVMFLILFVLNRKYAEVLVTTTTGKIMLGSAVMLSGLGLYVIKKITAVRI